MRTITKMYKTTKNKFVKVYLYLFLKKYGKDNLEKELLKDMEEQNGNN